MVTLNAQEHLSKAWIWARKSGFGAVLVLLVNFALPFLIYTIAKSSLGNFHALLIASSLTIAWAIIGFARARRIDALSILPLAGLGLALLAFVIGAVARNARLVQLRRQLAMAAIGLLFLASAAIGKPLSTNWPALGLKGARPPRSHRLKRCETAPRFGGQ